MSSQNPYAPPSSPVFDQPEITAPGETTFCQEGVRRPAGHGWAWYKQAWQVFKKQPLKWWFALIVSFGALFAASLLPFVNLLTSLLFPIVSAGLGACAASVQRTGNFRLSLVFEGFRKRPGALALAGAIYLCVMLGLMGVLSLVFHAPGLLSVFTGGWGAQEASAQLFARQGGLFFLAYFGVMLLAMSCIAFAPYLIHEHGLSAPQAIVASTAGSLRNLPAGLFAMLCYLLLAIAATIPLGLGWLVLFPVLLLTMYTAYQDIYHSPA